MSKEMAPAKASPTPHRLSRTSQCRWALFGEASFEDFSDGVGVFGIGVCVKAQQHYKNMRHRGIAASMPALLRLCYLINKTSAFDNARK
jgi:hypothetical protein